MLAKQDEHEASNPDGEMCQVLLPLVTAFVPVYTSQWGLHLSDQTDLSNLSDDFDDKNDSEDEDDSGYTLLVN